MMFRILLIGLIGLNLWLMASIVFGAKGFSTYTRQKKVHAELSARLAQVRADNRDLSQRIRLLKKDREYLEQVVRCRLHYVKANEVIYLPKKTQGFAPDVRQGR